MQDLCNSIEAAIKARVEAGAFPLNIYTGQGDFNKESPYLIVHARQGQEFPQGSGNWDVQVLCTLAWPAEGEDLSGFRQLCTDVFGLLMVDELAEQLSAADGLTVLGIKERQTECDTEGSMWTSTLQFTAYAFINDLEEA